MSFRDDIRRERRVRVQILTDMNMVEFMRLTDCDNPDVAIIAMHKTRATTDLVKRKLRRESIKWLNDNHYSIPQRPAVMR